MLKTLELQNFTVFKEARLDFSSGLNVIMRCCKQLFS